MEVEEMADAGGAFGIVNQGMTPESVDGKTSMKSLMVVDPMTYWVGESGGQWAICLSIHLPVSPLITDEFSLLCLR